MSIFDQTCCCVGIVPKGFFWDYYDENNEKYQEYLRLLEYVIERDISKNGFNYFISLGLHGASMDFAETIIRLRIKYPCIRLTIILPYSNFPLKWSLKDNQRYENILKNADTVHSFSYHSYSWGINRCGQYIVKNSKKVLAIWNADRKESMYNAIRYAEKKNRSTEYIMLPALNVKDFEKEMHKYIEYNCSLEGRKSKDKACEKILNKLKK